jgi:hypothetical protein
MTNNLGLQCSVFAQNEPNFPYIFQMLVGGPKRRKLTAVSSSSTKTGAVSAFVSGNGRADAIVTFNRRDFGPAMKQFGIEVLSPAAAVKRLGDP